MRKPKESSPTTQEAATNKCMNEKNSDNETPTARELPSTETGDELEELRSLNHSYEQAGYKIAMRLLQSDLRLEEDERWAIHIFTTPKGRRSASQSTFPQAPTDTTVQTENKPFHLYHPLFGKSNPSSPQTKGTIMAEKIRHAMQSQTSEAAKKAAREFLEAGDYCRYDPILDTGATLLETIIQSAIDAAASSFSEPCDVCGGTGTPVSKRPCICNGSGKMSIAVIELRKLLFDAERKLDAAARVEPTTEWEVHKSNQPEPYCWDIFCGQHSVIQGYLTEQQAKSLTAAHNASCAPTTKGSADATTPLARELSRNETSDIFRAVVSEFYLPLNSRRAFRNAEELSASETATIELRCPYCGTSKVKKDHTDSCPLGRIESLASTQTTKPTLTEGKESPPCAVKDQKG